VTKTHGEPDAGKLARPVRAGGLQKRAGGNIGTALQADPTGRAARGFRLALGLRP
jgi:hypothetical protein